MYDDFIRAKNELKRKSNYTSLAKKLCHLVYQRRLGKTLIVMLGKGVNQGHNITWEFIKHANEETCGMPSSLRFRRPSLGSLKWVRPEPQRQTEKPYDTSVENCLDSNTILAFIRILVNKQASIQQQKQHQRQEQHGENKPETKEHFDLIISETQKINKSIDRDDDGQIKQSSAPITVKSSQSQLSESTETKLHEIITRGKEDINSIKTEIEYDAVLEKDTRLIGVQKPTKKCGFEEKSKIIDAEEFENNITIDFNKAKPENSVMKLTKELDYYLSSYSDPDPEESCAFTAMASIYGEYTELNENNLHEENRYDSYSDEGTKSKQTYDQTCLGVGNSSNACLQSVSNHVHDLQIFQEMEDMLQQTSGSSASNETNSLTSLDEGHTVSEDFEDVFDNRIIYNTQPTGPVDSFTPVFVCSKALMKTDVMQFGEQMSDETVATDFNVNAVNNKGEWEDDKPATTSSDEVRHQEQPLIQEQEQENGDGLELEVLEDESEPWIVTLRRYAAQMSAQFPSNKVNRLKNAMQGMAPFVNTQKRSPVLLGGVAILVVITILLVLTGNGSVLLSIFFDVCVHAVLLSLLVFTTLSVVEAHEDPGQLPQGCSPSFLHRLMDRVSEGTKNLIPEGTENMTRVPDDAKITENELKTEIEVFEDPKITELEVSEGTEITENRISEGTEVTEQEIVPTREICHPTEKMTKMQTQHLSDDGETPGPDLEIDPRINKPLPKTESVGDHQHESKPVGVTLDESDATHECRDTSHNSTSFAETMTEFQVATQCISSQTDPLCEDDCDAFVDYVTIDEEEEVLTSHTKVKMTKSVEAQVNIDAQKIYDQVQRMQQRHQRNLRRLQRKFFAVRRNFQKNANNLKFCDQQKGQFLAKLQLTLPLLQREKNRLSAEKYMFEKQYVDQKKKNQDLLGRMAKLNHQFQTLGQATQPNFQQRRPQHVSQMPLHFNNPAHAYQQHQQRHDLQLQQLVHQHANNIKGSSKSNQASASSGIALLPPQSNVITPPSVPNKWLNNSNPQLQQSYQLNQQQQASFSNHYHHHHNSHHTQMSRLPIFQLLHNTACSTSTAQGCTNMANTLEEAIRLFQHQDNKTQQQYPMPQHDNRSTSNNNTPTKPSSVNLLASFQPVTTNTSTSTDPLSLGKVGGKKTEDDDEHTS